MIAKTPSLIAVLLAFALALAAPLAAAQENSAMHGQDSEFGSIRTPYAQVLNGQAIIVEAHLVVKNLYPEKDSRFFMLATSTENSPSLTAVIDKVVRTDTNEALPCMKRETQKLSDQCFVDLKHMPPAGTEILIRAKVDAARAGSFQVGFPVIAFTYNWEKVKMSNGLEAELYGYSQVNVQKPTLSESTGIFGNGNKVPGIGAVGAVLAVAGVAAVLGLRRRK